ncbi:xylulose kinase [Weizmannia acidilactici]|uniref:Xylulose kinase n=2 Tax=Heyndrickxia TaxID=2837504 RepID=A0A5J4JIR0_9BACI|nr:MULTISPECIES: xylulokinase [Heyndrickxia]KYC73165.1 Xylulose kinase [Heyndrickxia coagulans]GER67069.1 xylulose kinase [Weizmannia acidilactici]GER70307.1 xylulose kinase [Weizmannia acidilactici]GER73551.1 xylulose kinase [Weizmannia acidilactici]
MKYAIGVDLGTSSVKVLLVDQNGRVVSSVSKPYPLIQPRPGYSEQDPEEWVEKTVQALKELVEESKVPRDDIEGLSFSGQMHGLVLLDENYRVIRNAILWNDTRTTEQCKQIERELGGKLLEITKNPALEGFTLPKILWVKKYEPENLKKARVFLLPKDYLRFRLTGTIGMDYSDAAGTLLLDIVNKSWSTDILRAFDIPSGICPPLVETEDEVGRLIPEIAEKCGLSPDVKVFAGGADNACGAIGAGILEEGKALCSIGTSGVFLSYEKDKNKNFGGKVHLFNHGQKDSYYTMGVTLAAGYSLSWFKDTFANCQPFTDLLEEAALSPIGANGLIFTPFLVGERTPYADAKIRGTFTGIDSSHTKRDFARAVIEGIVFSIHESVEIFRNYGKKIDTVISIGGGAKSDLWLQIQADVFNATVIKLQNEQGPGMGAAMIAASGLGWYPSLKDCTEAFIQPGQTFEPIPENVSRYQAFYQVYKDVYPHTVAINHQLFDLRKTN